ncbi:MULTISPECIES: DUF2971 domain-containing protein [Rhizobium/Agrobacterium group]|uniref:DUF2971 domain-containing protein n=1 Tax=Agrobacterium tumefaciens TaxID=358 RepID=A0A2Z2PSR5_AGRTU|nr:MULTISPECIES: DUF2971 domain-containing protein [Rhizobium/Agrobacterium group]ASK45241.1 hypothetical protein [Agrobacterium radiobacter]NTH23272.1 DUF2971 domain-containing protein [Rhizobium rhizogenes]NTH36310.1 DUF2971 domain-containing protein [Rhizobium rhizogenes]
MKMIFKYFSDGVLEHAFVRDEHVGIKCSLPEDYNDPFELFLGIDLDQGSELLATYSDVVHEIPSLLTTCFSKSPVVSPMWAHYGNNHRGFVVGFDVSQIEELFPEVLIRDISYLDRPSETLVGFAEMAAYRKKPRDAMALQHAVLYHGYFSKYLEWSYEQEVRAVNFEDYVEDVSGNKILYVPEQCVAAIISGAKSSAQTRQALQEAACELDAKFYIEKIGRSYPTPYLIADTGNPSVFANEEITLPDGVCGECSEPLRTKGDLCPWCSIDESDQLTAAANNPFRVLENHGLLEQYIEKFPDRPRKPYK